MAKEVAGVAALAPSLANWRRANCALADARQSFACERQDCGQTWPLARRRFPRTGLGAALAVVPATYCFKEWRAAFG